MNKLALHSAGAHRVRLLAVHRPAHQHRRRLLDTPALARLGSAGRRPVGPLSGADLSTDHAVAGPKASTQVRHWQAFHVAVAKQLGPIRKLI